MIGWLGRVLRRGGRHGGGRPLPRREAMLLARLERALDVKLQAQLVVLGRALAEVITTELAKRPAQASPRPGSMPRHTIHRQESPR
jgi:hypothetical protein